MFSREQFRETEYSCEKKVREQESPTNDSGCGGLVSVLDSHPGDPGSNPYCRD